VVDNAADQVIEAASSGTDLVQSSVSYTLADNVDNLTLTGTAAIDGTGNELANVITGNALANTLTGNGGNDTLDGAVGADTMSGGLGNDTYVVDNAGDLVTEAVDEGTDLVKVSIATAGGTYTLGDELDNATLINAVAFSLGGNALANVLTGNALANTLNGAAGADTMAGGAGNDIYVVDDSGDVVQETSTVAGEVDQVNAGVSFTLGANLERLVLTGLDNIDGTGNAAGNAITGNAGNNVLDGGLGVDALSGGLGDDTYKVDLIKDATTLVVSLQDSISDTGGVDTVVARAGVLGLTAAQTLSLAAGLENMDISLSGVNLLNVSGNAADNVLTGNAANNVINGGAGADTMSGGAGNDTYVVDNAADQVIEGSGAGADLVQSSVSYTLADNVDNLTLTGTAAIDGTGNDLANVITGNAAANTLTGGLGADRLTGGLGSDSFRFVTTAEGSDTITDFASGTDKIYIVASNFGLTAGAGANLVINGTPSSAAAAFVYNSTTGTLGFDLDGNGAGTATQLATLSNKPVGFSSSDFVLGA
jgi:Ca2+-binding RTX toxin-like protein